MSNASNIGMLINHAEINHLLVSMSDALRNAAYKVANERAPIGDSKRYEYFDEDGTLRGYDKDSNMVILRDCLDHYLQFANAYGSAERTDFSYYLDTNFQLARGYVLANPEVMSYLTSLFATACGILSSVLQPVMENIHSRGQLVDRVESFVTGAENTYYLVYGEDIDNVETYDPKEDDLSDVDVSQSPEELNRLKMVDAARREIDRIAEQYPGNVSEEAYNRALNDLLGTNYEIKPIPLHPHINPALVTPKLDYGALIEVTNKFTVTSQPATINGTVPTPDQSGRINLVWNAPGTELL